MSRGQSQQSLSIPGWDRVRRLTVPVLLVLLLLAGLGALVVQVRDPRVLPVRVVGVDGEIAHLDRQHLEAAVVETVDGSFFSVDLERIREHLEQLPWIESASVRRVWPDTVKVKVVEQVPLAYWGSDGLVSQRGAVVRPESRPRLQELAVLEGDDESAPRIVREYLRMRTLLETAGLRLTHVRVDAREAWSLRTENGVTLSLGRREVMLRLTRFVQLYPYLQEQMKRIPASVDLRYTNGFTVRWREDAEAQANLESRAQGRAPARIAGI